MLFFFMILIYYISLNIISKRGKPIMDKKSGKIGIVINLKSSKDISILTE